jgi:4-aminobutyrate aminotransferase-like enzyme
LVNSGTEAIEGALKLARRVTGRSQLISCHNAYHGNTMGSMSVMGFEERKQIFRPLIPDIDFITKCGIAGYPHFKKHEYYTLWNKQSIVRELERLGFEVIVAKRNFKASYSNYYDVHIIAQKRYF